MTLDEVTFNRARYWRNCTSADPHPFVRSREYTPRQSLLQQSSYGPARCLGDVGSPLRYSEPEGKATTLSDVLKKLSQEDIPGKGQVADYLRTMYRRNCRPSTLRNSFTAIVLFLSFINKAGKEDLAAITRGDLGAFIEHEQDRGLKASTVQMRMRTLNAFIRSVIEKGLVHPDVLKKRIMIKVPDSLPRAIEPDDEKQLLSVIDHVRDRAMILVLLRTGMRIGELLHTTLSDITVKERKIAIFEAEKNRCGRVVYFSDDACEALKAWLRKRDPDKELLFYGIGRQSLTYGGARAMFSKYLRKAGLAHRGYSLHSLRHTNASELLNAGMPLECLKELLGHRCIEMTRRYARLTDKTREEQYFKAMAKIERGEIDGSYRCGGELPAIHKAQELLSPHGEELHEHP